jgi:hypothetical protein
MVSEAQKRASQKYMQENRQQVNFAINRKTEPELYEWIKNQENKQGYIKSLILADMEKHRNSEES